MKLLEANHQGLAILMIWSFWCVPNGRAKKVERWIRKAQPEPFFVNPVFMYRKHWELRDHSDLLAFFALLPKLVSWIWVKRSLFEGNKHELIKFIPPTFNAEKLNSLLTIVLMTLDGTDHVGFWKLPPQNQKNWHEPTPSKSYKIDRVLLCFCWFPGLFFPLKRSPEPRMVLTWSPWSIAS